MPHARPPSIHARDKIGAWLLPMFVLTVLPALTNHSFANQQRLQPWPSIPVGQTIPEELTAASGNWTYTYRHGLAPRVVETINRDWTFHYLPGENLPDNLTRAEADDSRWPRLALPHTWHTFETTGDVHPFTMKPSERDSAYWWNGWGVYRKSFTLDAKVVAGKKVFVEFDGVMKFCRVFLNGHLLGEHKGGYASFYFELGEHLRHDGPNILTVAVNARRDDEFRTPPMTAGNFNVYGGIYRDVRLVVKDPVHIPFQGSAAHEGGTFVTTPQINATSATVRVRTWIKNDSATPRNITLRTTILSPDHKPLLTRETNAEVAQGELHAFDQSDFTVAAPELWSPESPRLYSVASEVVVDGATVDRYLSPLGLRWFEWNSTQNRGYLNGQPLHIHGTNRQQEFPWLGDAMPKWMTVRDLFDIRFGQGHNFLRTSHYTQDELVYDLADRYGILICEEVPNIKKVDFSREVQRQQVIEMIRRDRNHPSIVMWSMGNETDRPADSAWAHAEDPTRILHSRRSAEAPAGKFITHTHRNMDMENLLRCTVRGWTDSSVADLTPDDGQHAGTEEWQHAQAMVTDSSQRGRIDMPNGVMWLYADHGADREYVNAPLKHINPKGWVDLYRIPKYLYFLWQANYTNAPMAFIHPQAWQEKNLGTKQDIIVDSNCDSVELTLNGRVIGQQVPGPANFFTVTFHDVPVERGELRADGMKNGKRVSSSVIMAGQPASLTLVASHAALEAGQDSVALLTADVVDAAGNPVQGFSGEIKWELAGPATLVSSASYPSDINRRAAMSGAFYIVAPVCTLVRSTGEPGTIIVTAKSKDLTAATITIRASAPLRTQDLVHSIPLSNAGRTGVVPAPNTNSLESLSAPSPMKIAVRDISAAPGKTVEYYRGVVATQLHQQNPEIERYDRALAAVLTVFAEHLRAQNGLLVADDFNFGVAQFNRYCALTNAIAESPLPADYRKGLDDYYLNRCITEGHPADVQRELAWIKALPADSPVFVVQSPALVADIFAANYPEAASLPATKRPRALAQFKRVNQAAMAYSTFDQEQPLARGSVLLKPSLEALLE
ncbi:MAG: glycoside hydrolase family 2 TIM barrel-domain containing protein [Lacunisphaera sp.]|nr:glycoside hydrolase family 2 TIM barrel-domain containing protein [Lacunisphaera sp.]